jgi:hypothetical protein
VLLRDASSQVMSKWQKALHADFHSGIVLTIFAGLPILLRLSLGLRAWW